MNNFEDEFTRVINKPDQYAPEVWHRQLERIRVGSKFFGLFPVYEYRYTEWVKEEPKGNT
jgi:hypothetical protein